jgi:hypothetical protein
VQILRDAFGFTRFWDWRDCSVQRNNQKVIEESVNDAAKVLENAVLSYRLPKSRIRSITSAPEPWSSFSIWNRNRSVLHGDEYPAPG